MEEAIVASGVLPVQLSSPQSSASLWGRAGGRAGGRVGESGKHGGHAGGLALLKRATGLVGQ